MAKFLLEYQEHGDGTLPQIFFKGNEHFGGEIKFDAIINVKDGNSKSTIFRFWVKRWMYWFYNEYFYNSVNNFNNNTIRS